MRLSKSQIFEISFFFLKEQPFIESYTAFSQKRFVSTRKSTEFKIIVRVTSYIKETVKFIPENVCLLGFSYRAVRQVSAEGFAEPPQTDAWKGRV